MTTIFSTSLSTLLINLFKGVLYRDDDQPGWQNLIEQQAAVRDYIQLLGLELILDEAEGYAYLRQSRQEDEDGKSAIPASFHAVN